MSHSLAQIFRKIVQTCTFPDFWKTALVSPLFKKGDSSDISNYRPVSLLCIPSKFFERVLFNQLYAHYSPYLHISQFGFRRNRSTVTQILVFLQRVYEGVEQQKEIDIIFTDYSKAFDRVDHGILLRKLFKTGLRGKFLKLLESYLARQALYVKVDSSYSSEFRALSGVPQGSILGPLFFLIFVNDLPNSCASLFPLLFADDAKFLSVGIERSKIQNDLDNLFRWTSENCMPFNLEKCAHIKIGKADESYLFGDNTIESAATQTT